MEEKCKQDENCERRASETYPHARAELEDLLASVVHAGAFACGGVMPDSSAVPAIQLTKTNIPMEFPVNASSIKDLKMVLTTSPFRAPSFGYHPLLR